MGALHVTACPDEAAQHCDAVVTGEGESRWLGVLADTQRDALQSRYTPRPETPSVWARPRLDLIGTEPPRYTLQTQRGSPFACEFCGASRLLGPFREKPAEAIREELSAILAQCPSGKSGVSTELADDNTFAGSRNPGPLLDALQSSGTKWFTEADWRIGERPELLNHLAESGCVQVLVGIESLVFRYPGMGEKRAQLDRIMDAVTAVQEAGVAVNGCFIVGADGETGRSLDRLTEFIQASPLAEVQLTLQTPFPGTGLYRKLRRAGRLLPDRHWSAYTLFDVTWQPDRMTVQELESGFRRVLTEVFSEAAHARRQHIRHSIWRVRHRVRSHNVAD